MQSQRRRKRARIVCVLCHERKKLKCDLEVRMANGSRSCTHCVESESFCEQRTSKRRLRTHNGDRKGSTSSNNVAYPNIQPAPPRRDVGAGPTEKARSAMPASIHGDRSPNLNDGAQAVMVQFNTNADSSSTGLQTSHSFGENHPTASSGPSYIGDSGFLSLFEQEHRTVAASADAVETLSSTCEANLPPVSLQESFAETYLDYCWPWCPVIEKDTLYSFLGTSKSPLLINALSLLGTQIRQPVVQHARAQDYYRQAKMLFYTDQERNPIICLQSIIMFYWWVPKSPSTVHKDSAWWWTGLAIKYAQQVGLHREPKGVQDVGGEQIQSIRRRIWWTLFARERLTGICQGRPCTIDPQDCNVKAPSRADFAATEGSRADLFIHWIRLMTIVGKIGKHRLQKADFPSFPTSLAQELIDWINSLPDHLILPFATDRTMTFNRDVHNLHLPYLTTLTVMHMSRTSHRPSEPLPEAYTAAMLAASCVARIFKDLLARGEMRFMGSIACWYVGVALLALLNTQSIDRLAQSGSDDIKTLQFALQSLATLWPSAAVFVKGIQRLQKEQRSVSSDQRINSGPGNNVDGSTSPLLTDNGISSGIDWISYFPYLTPQTSGLASILLAEHQDELWTDTSWLGDPLITLQDFFDPSELFWDPIVGLEC